MPKTSSEPSASPVDDGRPILRSSLTRFVLLSLVALVLVGVGIEVVSRHVARGEAIRDARTRSARLAGIVVSPLVTARLRGGGVRAREHLGGELERRITEGSFKHLLVYDADGTVLWSDDGALIGRRVDLSDELKRALGTNEIVSSLPGEPERHAERIGGENGLLEVYVPEQGADGKPFLFEAYIPPDRINIDRDAILQQVLPVGLGGLLLFQLTTLPLAFSLARRVDRSRRQRAELLRHSLSSWHQERRRLAQDLHDGVIQDLSAASYALPSLVDTLPPDTSADAARSLGQRIGSLLQQDLQALRSLIFDLLPPDVESGGLADALDRLADRHTGNGVEVRIDIAEPLDLGSTVAGLVYRVVREGLRNVERHADAEHAGVVVRRDDDAVDVLVTDDGRGLGPPDTGTDGHFGLRLLEQLVDEVGGTLEVRDGPSGGVVMHVRVPAALPT